MVWHGCLPRICASEPAPPCSERGAPIDEAGKDGNLEVYDSIATGQTRLRMPLIALVQFIPKKSVYRVSIT